MAGYYIIGAILTVFVTGSAFILCDIIWNNEIEEEYYPVPSHKTESPASFLSDDYEIDDDLMG